VLPLPAAAAPATPTSDSDEQVTTQSSYRAAGPIDSTAGNLALRPFTRLRYRIRTYHDSILPGRYNYDSDDSFTLTAVDKPRDVVSDDEDD